MAEQEKQKICNMCQEEIACLEDDSTLETPNLIIPLCTDCAIEIEDEIENDDIESDIEIDAINDENIEIELEENNEIFIEDNEIKVQKIIKRRKYIFGYKLINNLKNLKKGKR